MIFYKKLVNYLLRETLFFIVNKNCSSNVFIKTI